MPLLVRYADTPHIQLKRKYISWIVITPHGTSQISSKLLVVPFKTTNAPFLNYEKWRYYDGHSVTIYVQWFKFQSKYTWQVVGLNPPLQVLSRVGVSVICVQWSLSPTTLWRLQMETFFPVLALCVGNSQVTGEFPSQRPITRSFDVSFDLRLE